MSKPKKESEEVGSKGGSSDLEEEPPKLVQKKKKKKKAKKPVVESGSEASDTEKKPLPKKTKHNKVRKPVIPSFIGKRATRGARRQKRRKEKKTAAMQAQLIAQKNNESSYEESSSESDEWYSGDEHDSKAYQKGGYLKVIPGTVLNDRYAVQKRLGWGHFSMVFLALDRKAEKESRKYVAVKIQKCSADYQEAAEEEIPFLKRCLEEAEKVRDTMGPPNVARMFDCFATYGDYGKHYVMVFELLGMCAADLLHEFKNGLPISMVKRMMKDLLTGLDFLHSKAEILHMDIKPENVLFARTKLDKVDEEEIALRKKHYAQKADKKALKDAVKKLQKNSKLNKNQKKRLKEKIKKIDKKIQNHETLDDLPSNTQAFEDFMEHYCDTLLPTSEEKTPRSCLCDLGTACWSNKVNVWEVGTRYGRPPEMLVSLKYNTPADVWAMGCLCVELLSGDPLFDPDSEDEDGNPVSEDEEHLRVMLEAMGPKFPRCISNASGARQYMNLKGEMKINNSDTSEYVGLRTIVQERTGLDGKLLDEITDFLKPMLHLDPNQRPSAADLKNHEWLELTQDDVQETAEWKEENLGEEYSSESETSEYSDEEGSGSENGTFLSPSDHEREVAEINKLLEASKKNKADEEETVEA